MNAQNLANTLKSACRNLRIANPTCPHDPTCGPHVGATNPTRPHHPRRGCGWCGIGQVGSGDGKHRTRKRLQTPANGTTRKVLRDWRTGLGDTPRLFAASQQIDDIARARETEFDNDHRRNDPWTRTAISC